MSDANEYEIQRMRRSQKRKNDKKKMILFQQSQPGNFFLLQKILEYFHSKAGQPADYLPHIDLFIYFFIYFRPSYPPPS